MGFEKVKELNADTSIRLQNKGDSIEGYYHGSKEVPGKYGVSLLHIFETEDGQFIGVWGSGRLNYGLKLLLPKNKQAMMLRVTCDGTVPSSKGNDAYAYSIEKDKSRLTEAAEAVESNDMPEEDEQAAAFSKPSRATTGTAKMPPNSNAMLSDEDLTVSELEEEAALKPTRVTSSPVTSVSAANKAKVNQILGVGSRRS